MGAFMGMMPSLLHFQRSLFECAKIPWIHLPFDNANTSNSLYADNPSLLNVLDNDSLIKPVVFRYGDTNFDALLLVGEDRSCYKLICEEDGWLVL